VVVVALAIWFLAPAARAQEAVRSAWWNRANVGLLPTFAPPDVDDAHFLVEGVSGEEDGWTAVAALQFTLEGPVGDATLTLVASDVVPGSTPPVACAVTASFTPVAGGPWSDVPAHACNRSVAAETASGDRFIFRNVAPLASGDELRLLIVPTGSGRHVFSVPSAPALDVAPSSLADPAPAPLDEPASSESGVPVPPLSADIIVSETVPPAPALAAPDDGSSDPAASIGPEFELPAGDFGTRVATALVLAVALCAFTVMQRSSGTRLRPAQLRWRRPPAT
jgi:hypothetical protein